MKEIRKRGQQWDDENLGPTDVPEVPTNDPGTNIVINDEEGIRSDVIPEDDLKDLIERLEEKYPNLTEDQIKSSVNKAVVSKSKASIFYIPSESEHLWTYSTIFSWKIIEVNTNHSFYKKLIKPYRQQRSTNRSTLIAIELLMFNWL